MHRVTNVMRQDNKAVLLHYA